MGSASITAVRIDPEIKEQASAVFASLGLTLSAAVNVFLRASIREGGLPFELKNSSVPKPGNASLNHAFLARRDEFYTQYEDIAAEMANYRAQFKDRSVLCNCDDPFESAFFKYFVLNFESLGLKKLVCTSYAASALSGQEYPLDGGAGAYKAEIGAVPDQETLLRPDGSLNLEELLAVPENSLVRLQGDGDFRSPECIEFLKQADIVVTNPPFSLFREYMAQLTAYRKSFVILGNMNAVTCKEIFPLFCEDAVWYGDSIRSGDRKFYVPADYPLQASGCGIDADGRRFIRVKGVRWFTNLDHGRRHQPLKLSRSFNTEDYPKYQNYDAVEVGRTADIPADYSGIMGVPITFLDKYCPQQFEILMLANGNARTSVSPEILKAVGYSPHNGDKGGVGLIGGRKMYARILIRRRAA